jgi:hypothetical protein
VLQVLYPDQRQRPDVPETFRMFKRVELFKHVFGSSMWNKGRDATFLSRWQLSDTSHIYWPAQAQYFFSVDLVFNATTRSSTVRPIRSTHVFVRCCWFERHTIRQSQSNEDDVFSSRWKQSLRVEDRESILPVLCMGSSCMMAPVSDSVSRIITVPNQLSMWNPTCDADSYVPDLEGANASDSDGDSDRDSDSGSDTV